MNGSSIYQSIIAAIIAATVKERQHDPCLMLQAHSVMYQSHSVMHESSSLIHQSCQQVLIIMH